MKITMAREIDSETGQKSHSKHRVRKSDFKHHLFIESYGVKICITSNASEAIKAVKIRLKDFLPDCFREITNGEATHNFLLVWNIGGKDSVYKNGESVITRIKREDALESLGSAIRLTVAEFAVGRVFLHAGVVSWKNKAIVIPGKSFSGKTSLTAALVKRGAIYYSDEYAVLDEQGFVHPFPKTLSIRGEIDDYTQVEYPVEKLGGVVATEKAQIGMVLMTRYKPFAKWKPKILTPAKGMLEIVKDTIPIRYNPEFTLRVLNQVADHAIIIKSRRGDVSKSADFIIDFFETACFKP